MLIMDIKTAMGFLYRHSLFENPKRPTPVLVHLVTIHTININFFACLLELNETSPIMAGAFKIPLSLQKSVDATKVEYVQLGASGLRVSFPILGAMGLSTAPPIP